jgi:hypothetical protein
LLAGLDFTGANDASRTHDLLITNPLIPKKKQKSTTNRNNQIQQNQYTPLFILLSVVVIYHYVLRINGAKMEQKWSIDLYCNPQRKRLATRQRQQAPNFTNPDG